MMDEFWVRNDRNNTMIRGRQHSYQSTHLVLFRDTAAIFQEKASYLCMAFFCSSQKRSATPLHMK